MVEMVQRRAARLVLNRFHRNDSVTEMLLTQNYGRHQKVGKPQHAYLCCIKCDTGQSLAKMPNYNPLAIRTKLAPQSIPTHSRQPLGITTSIPSTQGQLQDGVNSLQGIQHCPTHWLLLKMQCKTFINTFITLRS